ncbi:Zinc/iron permease [Dichotomocladium elegans]|nr:Zinc/iron permease [Dichotomocladium elegans]
MWFSSNSLFLSNTKFSFTMLMSEQDLRGWMLVLISSIACVVGASVVFIDKFLFRTSSILESRSFLAGSMSLASGVLLYSSLSVLLPEAIKRLDGGTLVYAGFFGGALFTLILTRIIHWFTPDAVHACGGSPGPHDDEETALPISSRSSSLAEEEEHQPLCNNSSDNEASDTVKRTSASTTTVSSGHHHAFYGTTSLLSESHFRIHPSNIIQGNHDHHHHHRCDHHPHPQRHYSHHQHHELHGHSQDGDEESYGQFLRIGIQTAVAIGVHKFPEGLIMFVSNEASTSLGWSIAAAMSIHNLTEGFMIALPLYYALHSRITAFGWAALLGGLSQPLGAIIGYTLLHSIDESQENLLFGSIFAVVSGMMTLITMQVWISECLLQAS